MLGMDRNNAHVDQRGLYHYHGVANALVRSGKSRFTLSTLPATEFPVVDKIKSAKRITLPQKQLHELIERTAFSMAQQDVRYYLNGLMLEPVKGLLRAVATD